MTTTLRLVTTFIGTLLLCVTVKSVHGKCPNVVEKCELEYNAVLEVHSATSTVTTSVDSAHANICDCTKTKKNIKNRKNRIPNTCIDGKCTPCIAEYEKCEPNGTPCCPLYVEILYQDPKIVQAVCQDYEDYGKHCILP